VVQWVDPSAGSSCWVIRAASATVPSDSQGLRPRPGSITPTPATPQLGKLRRHFLTVFAHTATRRTISWLATPSLAARYADFANWTSPSAPTPLVLPLAQATVPQLASSSYCQPTGVIDFIDGPWAPSMNLGAGALWCPPRC
jgi:hypothetical protein